MQSAPPAPPSQQFSQIPADVVEQFERGSLLALAVWITLRVQAVPWSRIERGERLEPWEILTSARAFAARWGIGKTTTAVAFRALKSLGLLQLVRRTDNGTIYTIPASARVVATGDSVPFAAPEEASQGGLFADVEPPAPTLAQLYPPLDKLPRKKRNYTYPQPFVDFMGSYPERRGGAPGPAAYKAWRGIVLDEKATPDELVAAAQKFAVYWDRRARAGADRGFVPMPSSWLGAKGTGEWLSWVDGGIDPVAASGGRIIREL